MSRSQLAIMGVLGALFSFAGCQPSDLEVAPGNAKIGVSRFTITETPESLDVIGVDAAGETVAELHLRIGEVAIPEELLAGTGRDMSVTVRGRSAHHVSVGLSPLELPHLAEDELDELMMDPSIAAALARYDIRLADQEPVALDTPYAHGGSCSAFVPACGGTGYTACCLQHVNTAPATNGEQMQFAVCGNQNPAGRAERRCKAPGASTACGTAGAAGCSVCWTAATFGAAWGTSYNAGTDACSFAAPGVGATLFADDFNRTTGLGTSWSVSVGSFSTDGSYAKAPATGQHTAHAVPPLATGDYMVTASIHTGNLYGSRGSLRARVGAEHAYAVEVGSIGFPAPTQWIALSRISGSGGAMPGPIYVPSLIGAFHTVTIKVSGNPAHVEAWFDGVKKHDYTETVTSSSTQGAAGMSALATTAVVSFENFSVVRL